MVTNGRICAIIDKRLRRRRGREPLTESKNRMTEGPIGQKIIRFAMVKVAN